MGLHGAKRRYVRIDWTQAGSAAKVTFCPAFAFVALLKVSVKVKGECALISGQGQK